MSRSKDFGSAKANALFAHERNKYTYFNRQGNCFMLKTNGTKPGRFGAVECKRVKLKGITSLLRDIFWPNYVFSRDQYSGTTGARSMRGGASRGKTVHTQLCCYINNRIETFRKKYPSIHKYTDKVIRLMHYLELRPAFAEFIIYDPELRVASAIDALCVNSKGELVLIDWKCGFDHYYDKGSGPMEGLEKHLPPSLAGTDVAKLSNCPRHQAFFQVLLYRAILKHQYGIDVDHTVVVQIKQDSVVHDEVPPEVAVLEDTIYRTFRARVADMKMEKKQLAAANRKLGAQKRRAKKASEGKTSTKKQRTSPAPLSGAEGKEEIEDFDEMRLIDLTH